jgi:hypothetical protein
MATELNQEVSELLEEFSELQSMLTLDTNDVTTRSMAHDLPSCM